MVLAVHNYDTHYWLYKCSYALLATQKYVVSYLFEHSISFHVLSCVLMQHTHATY